MNRFHADDDNINHIGSDEWYWDMADQELCKYLDPEDFELEYLFDNEPLDLAALLHESADIEPLIDPNTPIVTDTLSDFIGWLSDPEWMDAMQDTPLLDEELTYEFELEGRLWEAPILSLQDPILSESDILNLEDYLNDEGAFFATLTYENQQDPELEQFFRTLEERDDA